MDISVAWVTPALVAQRLLELRRSSRNRRRLIARGGREARPETYRTMVALHALFLLSLGAESYPWRVPADYRTVGAFAALAAVTALRYWAIFSLG